MRVLLDTVRTFYIILHFPLLQTKSKIFPTSLPTRSLSIHTLLHDYLSDIKTAFQILNNFLIILKFYLIVFVFNQLYSTLKFHRGK